MASARFKGVKDLVFRGFLTTKCQIGEVQIVLKSLNSRELSAIGDRCPLKSHPNYVEVFESLFLAYALYIMDGENLLLGRPLNLNEMTQAMKDVPQNIRVGLLRELIYLQKAQDLALQELEAFSYTGDSRHTWGAYRGQVMNDYRLTGVGGTDMLGLNSHQIAWAYLNQEEDARLEADQQWGFAKFVASASNPKGVKKIEGQDKARRKKLIEERERVIAGQAYSGPQRIEAKTVVDLHKQLRDDLEGKQDLHDRIIEAYETSIQERRRQRVVEQQERLKEVREEKKQDLDNLTPEELASGSGFVTMVSKADLETHKAAQVAARIKFVQDIADRRKALSEQRKEDRNIASAEISKMVAEESISQNGPPASLTIPTGEHGPMRHTDTQAQPPRHVDTKPKANPRLAEHPASPRPPAATQGATTPRKTPHESTRVGTNPDGTPVYYSTDPRSQSKTPEGMKETKNIGGMPSKRLTRHTYGDQNLARKASGAKTGKKTGHTLAIDIAGEEDFFGGGSTSFTDKPAKK